MSKTHYQLSFTSRQALLLFVGFLLALAIAYFLGVMTGLAGRPAEPETPVLLPEPGIVPTADALPPSPPGQPTPAAPSRTILSTADPATASVTFPEPTAGLQLFEDRANGEPTPAAAAPRTPAESRSQFWVQVLSSRSEREARGRSAKLRSRGYRCLLSEGSDAKGKLYRVRVGPYGSREEAEKISARLSREEKLQTWIVPEPGAAPRKP